MAVAPADNELGARKAVGRREDSLFSSHSSFLDLTCIDLPDTIQ